MKYFAIRSTEGNKEFIRCLDRPQVIQVFTSESMAEKFKAMYKWPKTQEVVEVSLVAVEKEN